MELGTAAPIPGASCLCREPRSSPFHRSLAPVLRVSSARPPSPLAAKPGWEQGQGSETNAWPICRAASLAQAGTGGRPGLRTRRPEVTLCGREPGAWVCLLLFEPGGNAKLLCPQPQVTVAWVQPMVVGRAQCHLRLEAPQKGLSFWTYHNERKRRWKDLVRS